MVSESQIGCASSDADANIPTTSASNWETIAKKMQDHLASTLADVGPPLPSVPSSLPLNVTHLPHELLGETVTSITSLSTEILARKLHAGELTSVAVTTAFLQVAGLSSKLTNSITELLPSPALSRAKQLDTYLATHGKPIGPLHGIPISVKEHLAMKGRDWNAGFNAWVGNVAPDDALLLKFLWNAGCVFYCRTTEPQALMHLECSNNIYGVTVNPFNRNLTSGGSSGGEGALLGIRGSCLGIGTDIGGSIRSPAANNGVYGLRPTTFRLPLTGLLAAMLGAEHIVPVVGPMSTSLEGIKLFMKTVLDQRPWTIDPSLLPIPWSISTPHLRVDASSPGKRKLRVGVLADDGIVRPHPPILRGISTLVSALKKNPDIEIIDFPPYRHDQAWEIIASLYFADGGREEREAMAASGEPWRPLTNFIIKENPHVKDDGLSVAEVWDLTLQREKYKAAYTRHWNSVNTGLPGPDAEGASAFADLLDSSAEDNMVDVILCPVGPGCAPPLDHARYWGYTAQWNLLDYPALVFPTGLFCNPEEDGIDGEYKPRNEKDEWNHKLYNPETYVDAPISLQLVGRRYQDEKVIQALEMMREVYPLP